MASLNQCNFIGNAADAPEVRTFQDGGKVANLRIAVSERYTDRNGQPQENTEWISCVISGKLADVAEKYITKGMSLFVTGKYKTRQWQDQSGNKHYATEIAVLNFQILDKRQQAQAPAQQGYQPSPAYAPAPHAQAPGYAPAPQYAQHPAPQYQQAPAPQYQQAPPMPPQGMPQPPMPTAPPPDSGDLPF